VGVALSVAREAQGRRQRRQWRARRLFGAQTSPAGRGPHWSHRLRGVIFNANDHFHAQGIDERLSALDPLDFGRRHTRMRVI